MSDCEPRLGCATTRQLLEELEARGETEDKDPKAGRVLKSYASIMLKSMPGELLDYRTVDHE